jgi:hypothetical protein
MNALESAPLPLHIRRICGEYLEMPGLRLTSAQAQRLWGLDAPSCSEALQMLVEAGFLRRTPAGQYARSSDGAASALPLRMAKVMPGRKISVA